MDIVYIYELFDIDLEDIDKSKKVVGNILPEKLESRDFKFIDSLKFSVNIEKKPKKIMVNGEVKTEIQLICDRCLENFSFKIDDFFDYIFFLTKIEVTHKNKEFKLKKDDMDIDFIEDNILPLKDIIFGQIYLNIPIKKLCSVNCKGLCPNCGINLNFAKCNCLNFKEYNPFTKLKELLK